MSEELIARATIEELVSAHDHAIALYGVAFGKIREASEAMKAARLATEPFAADVYTGDRAHEVEAFKKAVQLPDHNEFMHVAKRLTSIQFWKWLTQKGDLQRLMDKSAREDLERQLAYVPLRAKNDRSLIDEDEMAKSFPPVTVENVEATIQSFASQADFIFRRGMANVFSKLDRRFRSHDGFKIGSRIILDHLLGSDTKWGFSFYGDRFDTLQDVERAFSVLDGVGGYFRSTQEAMRQAGQHRDRQAFEVETDYFRVKAYKNGNCHLWPIRDDLVTEVNKLLAEYYGEVVGDARTKEDAFRHKSGPLAKRDYDLYPTPDAVAEKVIEAAALHKGDSDPVLRVLEPSAGLGNLAIRAVAADCKVDVCEFHPDRAAGLRNLDGIGAVYQADFLALRPETTDLYDRVIMNPPWTGERAAQHVAHALKFLKPGGTLVAVMPASFEFIESNRATALREMIEKIRNPHAYRWGNSLFQDLPERSFAEVGTNMNSLLLTVHMKAAPAAAAEAA